MFLVPMDMAVDCKMLLIAATFMIVSWIILSYNIGHSLGVCNRRNTFCGSRVAVLDFEKCFETCIASMI